MTKKPIKCLFCNKSRVESHRMVASVNGEYSICDNCIMLFSNLLSRNPNSALLPPPTEKKQIAEQLNSIKIREFLDQFVVGQEPAKMALCVSVVNHYKRMLYGVEGTDINKSNLMIIGPSGSGKSLLVSTIAKFLDVPFISIDATTLTEAGYIGQNVDTIISRLLIEAGYDIAAAENGIVFIDEIDKISTSKNRLGTGDGKITGIQSALLKMVEGTKVPLNLSPDMKRPTKSLEVNTSNILFICGGAFIGLKEIAVSRLKKKYSMGFVETAPAGPNAEFEFTSEDFVEFGLIPEFVGRFPLKTYTKELTKEELVQILSNIKNNILTEYKFYFDVDGIELEFTPGFLERVAHQAKTDKIGVRGLRAICDDIMLLHLYLIPEYQKRGVAKITFHEGCIDKKQIPNIEIYEKTVEKKVLVKKAKV